MAARRRKPVPDGVTDLGAVRKAKAASAKAAEDFREKELRLLAWRLVSLFVGIMREPDAHVRQCRMAEAMGHAMAKWDPPSAGPAA